MPDEATVVSPVVSPTGTPLIPPRFVPLALSIGGAVVAGLEALGASVENPLAKTLIHLASLLVVGILGTLSPGWRR